MTDLQARARRILAQLSVTAEARAARLDAAPIAHHKPGHRPPPRHGPSSYDHHARRIRHARTRAQLEAAIEDAEAELDAIRYARRRADTTTIDGKLELATCPGPAAKVARIYSVSVRHVYTIREWARRHGIQT